MDRTIRNFQIHGKFHNHVNMNKHLYHNWKKVIRNNKAEYYPLIFFSPNQQNKKHPLIKTPKEKKNSN